MGVQPVASLNSGCLCQLNIPSSLPPPPPPPPPPMTNSAHDVRGLPIIVAQLVLIGKGFPHVEYIIDGKKKKLSPFGSNYNCRSVVDVHMLNAGD